MPNGNRAGLVAPARRAPRPPADPPGLSRHDAGPPTPRGPRARLPPAGGCRRWGASAGGPGGSTSYTPTRWRAPRSPTIDRDPSHRHHRGPAARQSAAAIGDPSRARTPRHARGPRMSRRRSRGPASRSVPRAVATATGAHGRAVSRGGGERPSAASGRETARGDAPYRRCPRAQTRRQATRPGFSCREGHAINGPVSARPKRPAMRGLSSSSASRAKTLSLSETAARKVTAEP
jgi:hypothetical protein